jgi:uncharacterized RDD family membrane protein YckC
MEDMNLNTDQLNIDTPELVSIEMPVAGIGSRFIAILVDYLIWMAGLIALTILTVLLLPAVHIVGGVSGSWAVGIVLLLIFLFHWGYFTLFEAFGNGRTPGKHVARIRVIHRSGRAISFVESLARNLVRAVDYLPSFYGVGLIAMYLNRQHQRLGDMAAGTIVVRDAEIDAPHWGEAGTHTITAGSFETDRGDAAGLAEPLFAPHLKVSLPVIAFSKLNTADLAVLEGFFARRLDMSMETRRALGERIASALRAKSGLEMPAEISTETFLEAVAHQLREVARIREH